MKLYKELPLDIKWGGDQVINQKLYAIFYSLKEKRIFMKNLDVGYFVHTLYDGVIMFNGYSSASEFVYDLEKKVVF